MKQKLIDYLLNNSSYLNPEKDKDLVTEIINKLDSIRAINPLWSPDITHYIPVEQKTLPFKLFLTTPMFRGNVNLKVEGNTYQYCCDEQIVLTARSEPEMIRKLIKYGVKL
jgi:hypothetical protein